MIANKDKNNKTAITNIANTMSITDAIDDSIINNKLNNKITD